MLGLSFSGFDPEPDKWRRLGWSNSIRVTDPLIRIIALSERDRAALSSALNQFLPVAQLFSTRRAPNERHNEVAPSVIECGWDLRLTTKNSEEVVMPIDSILLSVAVIGVLAFVCALLLADFESDHYSA